MFFLVSEEILFQIVTPLYLIERCKRCPTPTCTFIQKYEAIFEKPNKQLKTKDAKRISSDMDHLYVNQREMAAVASSDKCVSFLVCKLP